MAPLLTEQRGKPYEPREPLQRVLRLFFLVSLRFESRSSVDVIIPDESPLKAGAAFVHSSINDNLAIKDLRALVVPIIHRNCHLTDF